MLVPYLVGTPIIATVLIEVDGTPTDFDATPTLAVVDAAGVSVTAGAVTHPATGTYRSIIPASPVVSHAYATWSGDIAGEGVIRETGYEWVRNFLFTESQIRAYGTKADSTIRPLASETEYPDSMVIAERTRVTDDFESWTGRSWVGRYCRVELSGSGTAVLNLGDGYPRRVTGEQLHRPGRRRDINRVISATVDGSAVTDFAVDPRGGRVQLLSGSWPTPSTDPFNVVVEYEYGHTETVDGSDRVAMDVTIDRLVPSMYPERVTGWSTEYGQIRLVTEGGKNRTRLPHVNQWINDHDIRGLAV